MPTTDPEPYLTATNTHEDTEDRFTAALLVFLGGVPLLRPVDPGSAPERRLWRACELCTYLDYRLAAHPDPRSLSDRIKGSEPFIVQSFTLSRHRA